MGATVRNLSIAVIALAVIYTGASWAIGARVQSELQQGEQQLLASAPYVRIVSRDYQRGIYESSERVTYGIGGPMGQSLRLTPGGQRLPPLQLTVRDRIRHGPLPGFSTVALATVDTQLQLPPAVDQALRAQLGSRPPLQIHSVLGWGGGGRVELTSPALRMRAADGSTIDWQGLAGSVTFNSGMRAWSFTLTAPGLSASAAPAGGPIGGPTVQVELTGLRISSQGQLAYDTLHLGHTSLTLQQLQVQRAGGAAVRLQGLAYDTTATLNGDYIDEAAQLRAASLQAAQFSATQVDYAQRLTHVQGPAVAAFTRAMRSLQADPAGAAATRDAVMLAFMRFATQIAAHEPVLEISHAGFVTPEGQLQLSGRLTMPGLQAADLSGPLPMLALTQHVQLSVDLRADAALVDKLLAGSERGPALAAQLAVLEGQGYIGRDGGAYVSRLAFQSGRLSFNGRPYPPLPTAPLQAAPPSSLLPPAAPLRAPGP